MEARSSAQMITQRTTRESLIQAAAHLFHERGYNATSVQDIVSEAGVPKGTFYNYFESKEALAIAASDVFHPRVLSMLVLEASTSPSRRLRQYFRAISKELQRFEYLRGCLVGNFASEITNATPALKKRVAEHLDEATWRMGVVIEQGQKAGEIQADIPPMDLARFMLNSLYGAILRSKTETTDRPMRLFLRFAFEPFVLKRRKT
jgi:TetR/AcrR family transcriptional repressor of nem operon